MSDAPKSIDEAVKGLDPNQRIMTRDYLDLSSAHYISRRDQVETIFGKDEVAPRKDNTQGFDRAIRQAKKMFDKPVIVAAADATHYHYVNKNMSLYHIDYIRDNAKTWVPTYKQEAIGMPIQLNHSRDTSDTIGRVLVATPFIYTGVSKDDLKSPNGHIELIYIISDDQAIERVADGRHKFMSVSADAAPSDVVCSICNMSVTSWDCEHQRGKTYEVKTADGKKTVNKLAYWVWYHKDYKEASFVVGQADKFAFQKKMSMINVEGMDAVDSALYNIDTTPDHFHSLMIGGLDQDSRITNLQDLNGDTVKQDLLVSQDSTSADAIAISDSSASAPAATPEKVEPTPAPKAKQPVKEENKRLDQKAGSPAPQIKYEDALAGTLVDFIELGLSIEDAANAARDLGIYIPKVNRVDKKTAKKFLNDFMGKSAICRDALPDSAFVGPLRTVPVFAEVQADAALDIVKAVDKKLPHYQRIRNGLNRKKEILSHAEKTKPEQEDTQVAKHEFDSDEALLASPVVKEAIDKVETKLQQSIDSLNEEKNDNETKLKNIAIDSIIDAATKLDRPMAAAMKAVDSKDKDKVLEARNELKKTLEGRTFDSLVDTLDEYQTELSLKVKAEDKDPSEQALENAMEGKDGADGKGKEGTVSQSDSAEGSKPEEGTEAGKPGEELNQADSTGGGSQSKPKAKTPISSILKKT